MELNLTEVKLTAKEQKKHDVIKKVVNGELSKQEAQLVLNLSRKQIYRLIKIYNLQGEAGFSHKGKGRENKNKKSLSVINEIENLYLSEYFDYNFEAFYEEIQDKYDISYSVMYKAFLQDDIISPIAHKATNKLYNEKMENTIAKKSSDNVSDNLLESKIEHILLCYIIS